jgi:hypothetical protein
MAERLTKCFHNGIILIVICFILKTKVIKNLLTASSYEKNPRARFRHKLYWVGVG